jgi:hypothetical protein
MPVETPSLFAKVIEDHLALRERNSTLEGNMPLESYKSADPFENHPLFKTEEQARLEETMDGEVTFPEDLTLAWPVATEVEAHGEPEEGSALWGRTRDFDWGD